MAASGRGIGTELKDQIVLESGLLQGLDQQRKIKVPAVWGHAVHIGDVHLSDEVARLQQPLVEIRLPVGVEMDGVHLEPEGRGAEGADELRGLGQGAVGVGVDAADGLEGHLDAQLFRAGQDGLHAGAEQRLIGLAAAGIPGPAPDGAYDQLGAPQLGTQLRVGQHPVHRGLAPLLSARPRPRPSTV